MQQQHIILFDGVCNLCNSFVQRIIKYDKQNVFQFASLQANIATELLTKANYHNKNLNTVVYIKNGEALIKSTAALHIFKTLGWPYKFLFYAGIIFPKFFRDFIYGLISKNRYKWFGRQNKCLMPNAALKSKFLS